MAVLEDLQQAIISGDQHRAKELTQQALDEGMEPRKIAIDGIAVAMEVVGEKYYANEFYVPELLLAQRAMKQSSNLLSSVSGEAMEHLGTVVIGTVMRDLHDIGKKLVAAMLEGSGFKVVDLEVDVSPEQFVKAAQENSADIVAMSALLTTTMTSMRDTIQALEQAGMRDKVRVLIGGAPVTQDYADEINADAYAPDAATAVEKAKGLLTT
jgi:5-methyltetrahydrofolate--homocysteine methyltransferase